MTEASVTELGTEALMAAFKLGAPVLLTALLIGLFIGMIQSATQLQEATIAFVPKLLGVGLALMVCGGWMLSVAISYTLDLFDSIPSLLG